jgi:hypothetical protein
MATTDIDIADTLNRFFLSVFTDERDGMPDVPARGNLDLSDILITEELVEQKLTSLNVFSAAGSDGISNRILRECASILAPSLCSLFIRSIDEAVLPSDWLTAVVSPIFKSGSHYDPGNYRPVSLTSNVCKVLESIIRDQLMLFIGSNRMINSSQFGFLPGRSCELQLIEFLDRISVMLDQGDAVDVVYLDFKKAFDTVPHRRLLRKLGSYGVKGNIRRWVEAWLTGRTQSVRVGKATSCVAPVKSGVPQGSVLGPLLFLLYVNDIDESVSSGVFKFADDTKLLKRIYSNPISSAMAVSEMQTDLTELSQSWSSTWQMSFNVSKFACVHVGRSNPQHEYVVDGYIIPSVDFQKDLGVMITPSMNHSHHCKTVSTDCHRIISWIRRTFVNWNAEIILGLHKALIRPRLEYAVCAWCPFLVRDINLMERVQRRVTRMVPGLENIEYEDRLRHLGLQTLKTRRLRCDLILTFKIVKGIVDFPMDRIFQYARDAGTRGHSLRISAINPVPHRNFRQYSFSERVIRPWNNLSEQVVQAGTVPAFKRLLHVSGAIPEL